MTRPSTPGATLITGASSGIGHALAIELALRGEPVVAVARRKELLDTLILEIVARGGQALAVQCDVTEPDQVRAACAAAERAYGTIDRLIANAGGGERTPADEFRGAAIGAMMDLNVTGAAHCIAAVLPTMLARRRGHIVLMSSLAGQHGLPGAAGYSAAKAALTALGEGLRTELGSRGVDVTILKPGYVATRERRRPRPFEVPLVRATRIMADAIGARRRECAFPLPLVLATGLLRVVPPALADYLLRRLRNSA